MCFQQSKGVILERTVEFVDSLRNSNNFLMEERVNLKFVHQSSTPSFLVGNLRNQSYRRGHRVMRGRRRRRRQCAIINDSSSNGDIRRFRLENERLREENEALKRQLSAGNSNSNASE